MMSRLIKIFIFVFVVVAPFISEGTPHLMLHFDVNKTIIASDKAGNKSIENVINELLADKHKACWDSTLKEPITFDEYVRKVLVPGPKDDLDLREKRKLYLDHFVDYLFEKNHPLYLPVLNDFQIALSALQKAEGNIFPSFYYMIEELEKNGISFSIILRSFGHEVFEVRDEIDHALDGMFNLSGEFKKGTLHINGEDISEHEAIYLVLRNGGHVAIHDDWEYWASKEMQGVYGKPFYVNLDDESTLSLFFDDNIRLGNPVTNIISPRDSKSGISIPVDELVKTNQTVRVDTLEAILKESYFFDAVMQAIQASLLKRDQGDKSIVPCSLSPLCLLRPF